MPTPPANALSSTFQVGTYTSLTDTFTSVFDLNDSVTTTIMWNTLKMPQPEKVFVRSFNLRAPGERVTRFQYKNRHIQVSVSLRGATVQAILNTCHSLIAAIENPSYRLRIAQPNATQYTYATVVAVTHNIPADPQTLLAKALTNVQIDFECLPALLGDRVTLQNLVVNPGFEAPSGPAVVVFNDAFANVNAYSVASGGVPTVASSVMTVPANTTLLFGSPGWGAINAWQVRFQWVTGQTINFSLHRTDANNNLFAEIFTNTWSLNHTVSGTNHVLASAAPTTVNGNFYWAVLTQFPATPGTAPQVQAILYNDNAGAIGTQVAALGPVPTFDSVTALTGKMAIQTGASTTPIGGAFAGVHAVSLFGPGGWTTVQNGGTGLVSFAWEHALEFSATTYPNGPVTSYGAARIDFAPAGTISAYWTGFNSGTPSGSNAIPANPSQVFGVSAQAKTSGVGVGFQAILYLSEYNSGGSFLRQTQVQALTGVQPWMTLSGTVTTGANCAYVSVWLLAFDNSAGSVNGTIWFDNVQCWNQTTTGQTTMPYCELRFPQSPAQLMVSGLVGDIPTPAFVAAGTYQSSWPAGATRTLLLGRRLLAHPQAGFISYPLVNNSNTIALDANSYGGYLYRQTVTGTAVTASQLNLTTPGGGGPPLSAAQGSYHLFERVQTAQTAGNLGNIKSQLFAVESVAPLGGLYTNAYVASQITASATPTLIDHGQLTIPFSNAGSLTDLTQMSLVANGQWIDTTGGGSLFSFGVPWLLPIDADVLSATLINPSNTIASFGPSWLWAYSDGLGQVTGGSFKWNMSPEANPLPVPAHGAGVTGNLTSSYPSINPNASPYLTLDPQAGNANGASGVNQAAGSFTDGSGTLLPFHCELQYTPLYLYPR